MLVGYRMTPNPITISPEISVAEALDWMRQQKVHRFPVVDKKGKLVGIVTREDLLYASPSKASSLSVWEMNYLLSQVKVKEIMTRDLITVEPDCPIEDAARLMRDNDVTGLPVLRDGTMVGIITESDLFNVFLELFMAREKGIRLTVLAPYFKGSIAQISSAISARGGLIHALNTFLGTDPTNWGCCLRVAEISKEDLLDVIKPLVVEILDVREI
jgi:acetoin utilization protein AcuB